MVYLRSARMAKDDRTNTAERPVCDIATCSALKTIAVDSFTNLNTLSLLLALDNELDKSTIFNDSIRSPGFMTCISLSIRR